MSFRALASLAVGFLAVSFWGCGHRDQRGDTDGDHGHSHAADGSHSDSAQSFSGATHKEGTGITLLEETRKFLGIQTVEVQEQILPRRIRFTARVLTAVNPGGSGVVTEHLALGVVSTNDAAILRPGLAMQLQTTSGLIVTGVIQQVSQPLAEGEAEVVAAFSTAIRTLQEGGFGDVSVSVPGERNVMVVPREAVIKSANGNLVYAVNGDAFTLTWVELGVEADGLVEVTDGLLPGDSVVTHGAMDLWLVELRAVKGGQGCCPAPPKKGKG